MQPEKHDSWIPPLKRNLSVTLYQLKKAYIYLVCRH